MKTNEGKYATSHERWKTCNQYQGRKTCDPCQARENIRQAPPASIAQRGKSQLSKSH